MSHSETALAVAAATGWAIDAYAEDLQWEGVAVGPVGQHRDSGPLDTSNFEVIRTDLETRFPGQINVVSFGHWGFGWIEELAWNAGNPALAEAVEAWRNRLADHPVADEMHCSQVEWDYNHPSDGECYGDGCCSE